MNLDGLTQRLRERFSGRKTKEKTPDPTNRAQLRAMGIQGLKGVVERFEDGQVYGQRKGSFLGAMGQHRVWISHAAMPGWRERFVQRVFAHKGTRIKRTEQRLRAQTKD